MIKCIITKKETIDISKKETFGNYKEMIEWMDQKDNVDQWGVRLLKDDRECDVILEIRNWYNIYKKKYNESYID